MKPYGIWAIFSKDGGETWSDESVIFEGNTMYEIENYTPTILIKKYCINNNINKYQITNITIVKTFEIKDTPFEQAEVRFSSKLHLLKPDNWSCTEFENYLIDLCNKMKH